ncbi:fimbria/pilus outer membrane usher protein, partial [Salmonella enterica subsp. enterica serovar Cerro]|nr:fimbria/pilus outer membrane usher protein [Salmonella enterica subsp. enterica serovar Cerro]
EEQNGQTQEFDVNTASVPFLTRPGMVRYKMALGRPQDWDHHPYVFRITADGRKRATRPGL